MLSVGNQTQLGQGGTSRKDWKLTPMSLTLSKGDVNPGPGGRRVPELVRTDGPGFSLCAVPLESSGPEFHGVEQRLGEQVEVWRYTGPEMSERA